MQKASEKPMAPFAASSHTMKHEEACTQKRSDCAVSFALDVFGDKWSLLIIRDLLFSEKRSYGEFLSSPEGIATNILAARLKTLEERGIVNKTPDPTNGRRSLYHLTPKGTDLLPIVLEMMRWSAKHEPGAAACGTVMAQFKKDREGFLKEYGTRLKKEHKPHS